MRKLNDRVPQLIDQNSNVWCRQGSEFSLNMSARFFRFVYKLADCAF